MTDTVRAAKEALRRAAREQRAGMKPVWVTARSELIQGKVLAMERFEKARFVACYLAAPAEVRTDRILKACWDAGKDVCVPAFGGESGAYVLARMEEDSPLAAGPLGIRQPAELVVADLERLDLVIVPGLAFDTRGNRLGHGGGHYDRMLSQKALKTVFKVGVAFNCQVTGSVPAGDKDVGMDAVVTEEQVWERTGIEV